MSQSGQVFTRSASGLVRELTWFDVAAMTVSAAAASGILYYSVKGISSHPGASVPLAFIVGMLIFLPVIAVVALLSAAMPRAGSMYVAVSRIVGPTMGYLGALAFLLGYGMVIGILGAVCMSVIGGVIAPAGAATGVPGLSSFGAALSGKTGQTLGGLVWIGIFWAVTLRGARPFRRLVRWLFIIPAIATVIVAVWFLALSPDTAAANFDSTWGSGSAERIVATARAEGHGSVPFAWPATFAVLLVVMWAFGAIDMPAYVSGEVQDARRSMVKGLLLGWLGLGVLYAVLSFAVYRPLAELAGSYDYLYSQNVDLLAQIVPGAADPSVPFYAVSVLPSPWLGLILGLALVLWFVNCMPPFFAGLSRLVFALALDKAVPERLAEVNDRTGAPTWATHVAGALAVGGILLNTLGVQVVLATIDFLIFFPIFLYGLAGMLFPFRYPEIYAASPGRGRLLGIPIISIVGFGAFAVGWFIIFHTVSHMTGAVWLAVTVAFVLGMVVYVAQQASQRPDQVAETYRTVPPE
jgi:amino acid transporter